jgi:hypothetical protein
MDFKKATDELTAPVSHEELAAALKVSIPTVRQARLDPSAKAYRRPPEGWARAVIRLAEAKAERLNRLAARLRADADAK